MSDKQLQRVTEGVADIGHASVRRALPARRAHTTQKIRIAEIARPMSIALQYGASLEKLGDFLAEPKYNAYIDLPSLFTASKHLQKAGPT
jgi:hypothetical protein